MYLNPVLQSKKNGEADEVPTVQRKRAERSDKIKDIKIPVSAEEWAFLESRFFQLQQRDPDLCQTDVNTQMLIDAVLMAERYPEYFEPVVYDPGQKFITCKPTVFYHEKIKQLRILWDVRSIRKVAHRLLSHAIRKVGGPIAQAAKLDPGAYPTLASTSKTASFSAGSNLPRSRT